MSNVYSIVGVHYISVVSHTCFGKSNNNNLILYVLYILQMCVVFSHKSFVYVLQSCCFVLIITDINECANNPCDHTCINNEGSFVCVCNEGYRVENNTICVGM